MRTDALAKTEPTVQLSGRKGARTRDVLLDLAYESILAKGFSATSIDELIEAAGISKGGFFYHFKDKNDLARQLLIRYLAENTAVLDDLERRARELSEDPLHAFLIFMKLYAEMVADVMSRHPGCIVATLVYQDRLFDQEVARLNRQGMLDWRARFLRWLEAIAPVYPPRIPVVLEDLADQMTVVTDGSLILQRSLNDSTAVARQALLHRAMLKLVFLGK